MKWFFFLISTTLFSLTLEEKVGQLLMVYFDGEECNEESRKFIDELHVGGFIYYSWANGLTSLDQVKKLSRDLQSHSKIPLLIATDQEGGYVTRFGTQFPGNSALGYLDDTTLTYQATKQLAIELAAVGINMNFAPDVDLNLSFSPTRSFGFDPKLVKKHAQAAVQAHLDIGVIPTLKHFPGHGHTDLDSHNGLPHALSICPETFAIDAPAIMTAHILTPLDPKRCATTSPIILKELLRKKMNYQGLIISDSITMKGILDQCGSLPEAAIAAIEAGCDMIIIGGRSLTSKTKSETSFDAVKQVYAALLEAVKSGRIDIEASVSRILSLKKQPDLASELTKRSCLLTKGKLPTLTEKTLIVAPRRLEKLIKNAGFTHTLYTEFLPNYDNYIAIGHPGPYPENTLLIDVGFTAAPCPNTLKIHSPTSLPTALQWLHRNVSFITPIDPHEIGQKVWQNECKNRIDQLTFWNKNEPFPSMGIGHFIWPPKSYDGPFKAGRFHDFLAFLSSHGIAHDLPLHCPYETREEFYAKDLTHIQNLLTKTIPLQVAYMTKRLNHAIISIIEHAPEEKRPHIMRQIYRLSPYILIDYLNFKHEGIDPNETYNGEGWGLLHVLSSMEESESAASDFVKAATTCLERRIKNNPSDACFLQGWKNRLRTYL